MTNDRPWRLADLSFAPSGNGRERATINGVEVVRENGRYWITTPNGPIWSNIDERGVDPALNYLFGKRKQEQSRGTRVFPSDSLGRPRRRWPLSISIAEGLDVIRQQFCKFVAAGQRQPATLHIKEVLSGLIGECYLGPLPRFIGMTVPLDQISAPVKIRAKDERLFPIAFRRDIRPGAALADMSSDPVGVIASVKIGRASCRERV